MYYKTGLKLKSLLKIILILLVFFFTEQNHSQNKNKLNVEVLNFEKFKSLIDNNRNSPLLINVWATWCIPCREEFPELVKLSNDYKDKVRVIGISLDEPEVLDAQVVPFIKNNNAEFENYILKVIEPEDFINLLNKEWSGAIPATFVYDKNGNQEEILIGKQSYESFEKAVRKVIE